ncbi:hypothetical protein F5B22DRAFT_628518 [Xylaria bambusicola]|uniref:uncharacterized protein n=1 Tax=Xylaria bambusicola TaxID=326684 RepID=UPI002008B8B3|nr:uncharacterized protein F5B22DRAFT_628518 [Xylaria bambusicola]KAI0505188.1 hypothetical protein F5B22DRAFT_628518 [Xylaria bambusicola]
MKDDNQDSEEFNSLSIPTAQAAPNTTIPASIDSISSWVPPTMLEYNFSGASTSSQNNMVPTLDSGIHPSALQWGEPAPASRPSPFAPRPISAPLQALFLRVGVNPATRRTEKKVTLSDNQLAEARQRWEEQVVQQFTTLEEDTEDEKNYLDTWDFENRQFQWQTEGLFLCRLMEIKEQVTFREAKSAFQVAILKKPSKPHWTHPKGTRLPPSSLRNEIKWESTPENGNDTKSDKREDQ